MVRSMAFTFTRYNFVVMCGVKTLQKIKFMPKIQPCQNWGGKKISQKELFLYHSRIPKVNYKNINMLFTIRSRLF